MYWYILFSLVVIAILSGVLIYYYSYEGFQNSSTGADLSGAVIVSPDNFDSSGVNLQQVANDISGSLQDLTADRRPVDSGSRLCEGITNQIAAMEEAIKKYNSIGDYDTSRITNKTIKALKKQKSEAGC